MTKNNKKKSSSDPNTAREIQHLQKVFGSILQNYSHSGYQRADLPYIARDAAKTGSKKKRK